MSDRDRYDDEELAEVAEDLARELRGLRADLESERGRRSGPPRGPFGLPRPPTPREVLEFADEFAIPALIALLEANIKLLEGLRRVIRVATAGREARERGRRARSRAVEAADEAGRETLSRLSDSLSDLRRALEGEDLPGDPDAREILEDVRDLQSEVDERLRRAREGESPIGGDGRAGRGEGRTGRDEGPTGRSEDRSEGPGGRGDGGSRGRTGGEPGEARPGGTGTPGSGGADGGDDGVGIDVDAELDSLRERYREGDDGEDDGDEGSDPEE